jgi:hypothetical protein
LIHYHVVTTSLAGETEEQKIHRDYLCAHDHVQYEIELFPMNEDDFAFGHMHRDITIRVCNKPKEECTAEWCEIGPDDVPWE